MASRKRSEPPGGIATLHRNLQAMPYSTSVGNALNSQVELRLTLGMALVVDVLVVVGNALSSKVGLRLTLVSSWNNKALSLLSRKRPE